MFRSVAAIMGACFLLSACNSQKLQDEHAGSTVKPQEDVAKTEAFSVLGLTELQLLNADVFDRDQVELGEVEQLSKDASGTVTGLVVEIEDSDPDRYVLLPLAGVDTIGQGTNIDLRVDMTKKQFLALPAVELPPPSYRRSS